MRAGTAGGSAEASRRHQAVVPAPLPAVLPLALAAFNCLVSRLRLRAAVFLWIVPLPATRSSRRVTLRSSVSALAKSPPVTAALKALTWSLIISLRARLRARRFRFCRTRFLADNEWATKLSPVSVYARPARRGPRWARG